MILFGKDCFPDMYTYQQQRKGFSINDNNLGILQFLH